MSFKSGIAVLIGYPNVGKSTLLNQLIQYKVAIVSDKAQTTRETISAIYNDDESQILFLDTPGIHQPKDEYGRFLNKKALGNIDGADIIYFLSAANKFLTKKEREILTDILAIKNKETALFLLINKIDLVNKMALIPLLQQAAQMEIFDEIIPISGLQDDNLAHLLEVTKDYLKNGEPFYSPEQITTLSERFFITEIIREKILYFTKEEIPHQSAVVIDAMHDDNDGYMEIIASIIVTGDSQKPILIGKQGAMIKKIRLSAQKDLRQWLQKPIKLQLFVKVDKNWRKKNEMYYELNQR